MIKGIPKGYRRGAGTQTQRSEGDAMSQTVEDYTPTSAEYKAVAAPAQPRESPRREFISTNVDVSGHPVSWSRMLVTATSTGGAIAFVGASVAGALGAIGGGIVGVLLGLVVQRSHTLK